MLQNQLLQQAQAKLDESVTNQDAYERIVKAAMKAVYDKNVFDRITKGLVEAEDPIADIAKGVIAIIGMLAGRAQGKMPPDAALQAGFALLLNALDFAEQAGLVEINNETVERAATEYIEAYLPSIGITPEKMESTIKEVEAVIGDEEKMRQFKASQEGLMTKEKDQ